MKLAYQAFDRAGKAVADVIDAPDPQQAGERLRSQGLYVTNIKPSVDEGKTVTNAAAKARGARLKDLTMFTRQLQVLISTGTPLVQALGALERQAKDVRWQAVVSDVRNRVEEGAALSDAMSAQPKCFDVIYRSLISAGESSGKLDAMLGRLSGLTRQQLRMRSSIVGAMIYPCLLLIVAVSVLVLMIGFVLPRFASLYTDLDAPLPPSTQILMRISELMRTYWWAGLGGIAALVIALRFYLATPGGKRMRDRVAIGAPQLGRIVRSFATARLARLLGVLTESHVPLLDALVLTRQASKNSFYAELVGKAEDAVTRGDPMSSAFAASPLISPYVTEAIRSGEQTGQIAPLLLSIADFMDEENEVIVRSLTSIIEPMILIVLGAMVGLVALSMFMPLFDLTAMTQGGGPG